MATNILMPALSPTMTEGTLARWLKKEGETIKAGDVIAEIETDKATMEVEAVDEGVLGKILVEDGTENVKVNAPIAVLVDAGEAVPNGEASAPPAKPAAAPKPAAEAAPKAATSEPGQQAAAPAPARNGHAAVGRADFCVAARAADGEAGWDRPVGVEGQRTRTGGSSGRISRRRRRVGTGGGTGASAPAPAVAPAVRAHPWPGRPPRSSRRRTSWSRTVGMRKVIAKRLTEAKSTIPHFYVSMDIEIDAMIALLGQLNAKSPPKEAPGAYLITINDMVIKAAAATLAKSADGQRELDRRRHGVLRRRRYQRGGVDPGRADHADHSPGGHQGPGDDQPRDEGPGRTGARRQAEARGIPGRRVLDLQHGDVRGVGVLPPSSTRRRPRSWRWRPGGSGRW